MTAGSPHHRLLTLDAHLDAPVHFGRADWSFGDRHHHATEIAQLDLPRMADGNLSGGFFVVYTPQGPLTPDGYAAALAHALRRSDAIDAMLARFPDAIGLALCAGDAERLHAAGKLIAFKSMENSYPIGKDLTVLARLRDRGVRLAGPVHDLSNQLGDSATDAPRWNGISPLGRDWVAEMNRLGLLIDASHASDAALDQMLDLSRAPLLLSHSSARAIFDHPRNIDDARLRALAAKGGLVGASTIYLSSLRRGPERAALFRELGRIDTLDRDGQADLIARWRALDATEPLWDADFERYIAALLHLIDVAGIEHVCFGADWDGGGGLPGLEDITALPSVTDRLAREGYTQAEIALIWGGNLLRLLRVATDLADHSCVRPFIGAD